MSEYQYYEFLAIDRPLTDREMQTLRACSSRATITPTRFVNEYHWGDFKGNASQWMEKYFDAFVYVANWRTREFMLRLPKRVLPLDTAKLYLHDEWRSVRTKGDHVVIGLLVDDEDGDGDGSDDGSGWLGSLLPLRADIAAGDFRALYLAWLRTAQTETLPDDAVEPPVPAGLADLTGALQALIEFLGVDGDLVAVAAAGSSALEERAPDIGRWIAEMPEAEKTAFLVRIATGEEPLPRAELLRRCRAARDAIPAVVRPRRVADLLAAAHVHRTDRRRRASERDAKERARREREATAARERYLDELAARESESWRQVNANIETKKPGMYDQAVSLLRDLRDLAARSSDSDEFDARVRGLQAEHSKKVSFLDRLRRAGLARPADAPLLEIPARRAPATGSSEPR